MPVALAIETILTDSRGYLLCELLLWSDEAGAPCEAEAAAVCEEKLPRLGRVGVVLEAGLGAVFAELLSSEPEDEAVAPSWTLAKKILAARLHFGTALMILNSGPEGDPRATIF
jgi:hypothetical protein